MSETYEHQEVLEKIASPNVEVTDDWLEEMAELSVRASIDVRCKRLPDQREQIRAAREEYFERLGWTDPDSPYEAGYAPIRKDEHYMGPRPVRLIENFSKLADQGVDLRSLTPNKVIKAAGGEGDRLNKAYGYIRRVGDLAVRVVASKGVDTEGFDTADLVGRDPHLLLMSREKLRGLARYLFGLNYPSLTTDMVANDITDNAKGTAHTVDHRARVVLTQSWQKMWSSSDPEKTSTMRHWYNRGANKATHENGRFVKEARLQFVNAFMLENTNQKLAEAGKALTEYAEKVEWPLPRTNYLVGVLGLLQDVAPDKGIDIVIARPELLYIPPTLIKEKLDMLNGSSRDLLEILMNAPHLIRSSPAAFLEKVGVRTPRKINTAKLPEDRARPTRRSKPRIPVKVPEVDVSRIDEAALAHIKQLCEYSQLSLQDFLGICPGLATMPVESLERITKKVEELYESDKDCSVRTIARLAREEPGMH